MRIYDGDFTIRALMEDCRVEPGEIHKRQRVVEGIDINLLNARLSHIPIDDIRRKKQRMEVFYQEVMLSADPDRGVNFSSTLMILAHYNIIEDSRSLRLEEFLRRRARLQRVHESIRRNIVVGFFDTMFWSRRFRQATAHRRNSRLGGPPSMPVPEIIIDDDPEESGIAAAEPQDFLHPSSAARSATSPMSSPRLPRIDTSFSSPSAWARDSPSRSSFDASPTTEGRPRLQSVDTSYHGTVEPRGSLNSPSADRERTSISRTPPRSPTALTPSHSRNNSTVVPTDEGVMESFGNSAWGESIRRGLTQRASK